MVKEALSLFLAAGLVLTAVPGGAEVFGPNSVWGAVPRGLEGVANALLLDASGKTLAMVPIVDGKFAFRDVAPGEYTVGLYTASGQQVTRSCSLSLARGAEKETSFDCPPPAAQPVAPAPRGGLSTTTWILLGAAAAGVTTAIVIATSEDEGVASPTR